ncbi:GNAT family N-acetyltransferase [Paenisporosarcina antarctica]|uniref:GNAT family N-acetyltransferase n=1 Tax=Paenisporosarcina antarctica TaxID=417367 RepID=UPI001FB8C1BE|nr:GNAT family N-acetyltransferase [Paenisporosarcina antarctica]
MCKKCEVGYDLHPSYWSKVYIKEALGAVLPYCVEELTPFRDRELTLARGKRTYQK